MIQKTIANKCKTKWHLSTRRMTIGTRNLWLWAFTFVELIVATTISAIVLLLTFWFVANTIGEISYSIKHSKILISYNELFEKLNNYRNVFLSWAVLIDNATWMWNDVLLLSNLDSSDGVVFWVVNRDTMKLEQNARYLYYYEKVLWYRKLSQFELSELAWDKNKVYDYSFYEDKLFENLKIKDFQLSLYNSWTSFEGALQINLDYKKVHDGKKFTSIWSQNINKFNLSF